MKNTTTTATIYLRVSTDEQAASGLGLEAQEAACRAFAAAKGWAVGAVHRDEGVSGSTPADKRPGLMAALAVLKRGGVLLAAKRDRLARSVGVAAVIETMAGKVGAAVVTPDAPDSDDPFGAAMRGMMDVFAQLERAMIAQRTAAALAVKKARGEKLGGSLPLGCGVDAAGRLVDGDAAEREALDIIRALRADGMSIRAIAAELNARGVKARGAGWHATTVARVLGRAA
jgi:DNA invertase Pin-like site-specific DNA recombinase